MEKLKNHLAVYLTDAEYSELTARAATEGVSASAWARRAVLEAMRAEASRIVLPELQDALDRTLSRHLRRLAALLGVAAREASAARKFAEAAQFVVTYPEQGAAWARRAGGQEEIVRRAERYAHEQVRRATDYAPRTPRAKGEAEEAPGDEPDADELHGGGAA